MSFKNLLNEFVWPQSDLSPSFQVMLKDAISNRFSGLFYVVGRTLYFNDEKLFVISDNDSINSVLKKISRLV